MTSDKLVDNKTRTMSTFLAETLPRGNLCFFYYLEVVSRSAQYHDESHFRTATSDRSGRRGTAFLQANAISLAPGARTECWTPATARNACSGASPVSKRPA